MSIAAPVYAEPKTWEIDCHFNGGPTVIFGDAHKDDVFRVKFWDKTAGRLAGELLTKAPGVVALPITRQAEWALEVFYKGKLVWLHEWDPRGKKVLVSVCSRSLGDTLAWIPKVDEFRQKWDCQVICLIGVNTMGCSPDEFLDYPELRWRQEASEEDKAGLYATYRVGLLYEPMTNNLRASDHAEDWRRGMLQDVAAHQLGLPKGETRPKVRRADAGNPLGRPYVAIAPFSTAQAKFWNREGGWQAVVDWIKGQGLEVVCVSKEEDGFQDNWLPKGIVRSDDFAPSSTIRWIQHSRAFVGLGSGLSWLSWSLEIPTVMISGFSLPFAEPSTGIYRVAAPEGICAGCYHRYRWRSDKWNFCPDRQGSDREFECTKSIAPERVIEALAKALQAR